MPREASARPAAASDKRSMNSRRETDGAGTGYFMTANLGKDALVEPLVVRIERRDRNVHDLQFPDRAVAATRLDENRSQRLHRIKFTVEFHEPFAFQDE